MGMRTAGKTVLLIVWGLVTVAGLTDVLSRVTPGSVSFTHAEGSTQAPYPLSEVAVGEESGGTATTTLIPVRLHIPRIGVDAPVESVGVNAKGNMAVPSVYSAVGWYENGPRPGAPGNSVIAGHLDNSRGTSAVFVRLRELQRGDRIFVSDKNDNVLTFVVTRSELYAYTDSPGDAVFTSTGDARLVLITCEGEWDPTAKSYDKRRVVYAQPL